MKLITLIFLMAPAFVITSVASENCKISDIKERYKKQLKSMQTFEETYSKKLACRDILLQTISSINNTDNNIIDKEQAYEQAAQQLLNEINSADQPACRLGILFMSLQKKLECERTLTYLIIKKYNKSKDKIASLQAELTRKSNAEVDATTNKLGSIEME